MAKKFDLSQYIDKAESKMDTLPRLTAVELHLIDPSATNFYSMPGIEQLADNIATVGLLEPPRVREKDGRYVLVSGQEGRAAGAAAGGARGKGSPRSDPRFPG